MNDSKLFQNLSLGPYVLQNRIVLPPLTRSRSTQPGNIPNELMATYYQQRAGTGFMVTEGTQIEPRGQVYAWTPGIYSPEQIAGWRKVTEAVHAKGGIIFAQLWHVGRVSHTSLQPDHAPPVAPSAIRADSNVKVFIETGPYAGALADPSMPRALSNAEVKELVQLYAQAARNALAAGFDGVEIHCANGYLVNQFISAHSNHREEYVGSLNNRLRFLREVVQAVAEVFGADRLGVRFAPLFESTEEDRVYMGLVEDDPHVTYIEAIKILEEVGIAYLSIAEADWDNAPELPHDFRKDVRDTFSGRIIYAGRYTAERGARILEAGLADLIAFGRPFIANPDLPDRIANGWPLNAVDASTMYGGTEKGYIDYPAYAD